MAKSFNIDIDVSKMLSGEEVTEELTKRVQSALKEAAVLVQDDAKRECPVDTGTLRSSINYQVDGMTASIGTNVEYAPYVHEGTSKMAGRPFLMNAAEKNKEKIKSLIKEAI